MEESHDDPLVFHRILLTVDEDDQPSSVRAFRFALTLAKDYQATLGIVSVLENNDISIYDSLTPAKLNAKRDDLNTVVADYQERARHFGVDQVRGIVAEGGDVDDVILRDVLPDFRPDLIIAGADTDFARHGHPGATGLQLARKAPVSVIVIK